MPPSAAILHNEKELFALMSQGDQVAFTKIFDHYEPRLYSFILKMTRSETDAEEIVQELFIKLWTGRDKWEDIQNPRAYIFRMAIHRTVNYLKSMARNEKLIKTAARQLVLQKNTTEEAFDYKEMRDTINRVVEQLPAQQRRVCKLSRQQGLKAEEIAEQMNLSKKTVKNHLTEALRSIKDRLQQLSGTSMVLIIFLLKHTR